MLKVLNNNVNFDNYKFFLLDKLKELFNICRCLKHHILKEGKNMKKNIVLLSLMFSLLVIATDELSFLKTSENLNKIITLRVMGVTSDTIWNDLGISENTDLYFNDRNNLYECKNFLIDDENCTKINIDYEFPYHIKDNSLIRGYSYIFNDNEEIKKENSYIIAKNYVINENYTYDENTKITIDNDCIKDSHSDCIVSESTTNNIIENLMSLYENWATKISLNNNYSELKRSMNVVLFNSFSTIDKPFGSDSEYSPAMPYDSIRVALTVKILNDLNISFSRDSTNDTSGYKGLIYYNHNSEVETDFSCELFKIKGDIPSSDLFNLDACNLQNTFSNHDNILNFEKRVFYQKTQPQENSNLYFDKTTYTIKELENEYEEDSLSNSNSEYQFLEAKLTNKWSDDLIVNTDIFKNAANITNIETFKFGKYRTNQNLWSLVSTLINKTFKFYEKKTKARAKIKQLMELKSIGLLSQYRWDGLVHRLS
jgi:hypothetical protein